MNRKPKCMEQPEKTQADKFKEVARKHGADEDEKRWDAMLKKVVKHKPVEKPA